MPRCLMAKKWKAYPWQDRVSEQQDSTSSIATTTTVTITTTLPSTSVESVATSGTIQTVQAIVVDEEEEIDVVGDSPSTIVHTVVANSNININSVSVTADAAAAAAATHSSTTNLGIVDSKNIAVIPSCWGPSSPTAGTTAPSPPPYSPEEATRGSTILYNGE